MWYSKTYKSHLFSSHTIYISGNNRYLFFLVAAQVKQDGKKKSQHILDHVLDKAVFLDRQSVKFLSWFLV